MGASERLVEAWRSMGLIARPCGGGRNQHVTQVPGAHQRALAAASWRLHLSLCVPQSPVARAQASLLGQGPPPPEDPLHLPAPVSASRVARTTKKRAMAAGKKSIVRYPGRVGPQVMSDAYFGRSRIAILTQVECVGATIGRHPGRRC